MYQSFHESRKVGYNAKLNLVALMDIFTILVFFLLLNTGEAEKLESAKFVKLPDAKSGITPHNDLVVIIGENSIWFGKEMLASIDEVATGPESSIPALSEALADYRERKGELNSYEEENGLSLTIMGDQAVPFGLLKTVMVTCRLENFRDIALAVNQLAARTPSAVSSGGQRVSALAAPESLASPPRDATQGDR